MYTRSNICSPTHTHTHTRCKWLFLRTESRKPQSACCQLAKLQCRAPSQHTVLPPETLSLSFSYTYSLSLCFIVHLSFISHSFNTWVLSPWCAEPLFLYINVFFSFLSFFHFIHSSLLKLFFHHLMLWGCNIFSYYWLSIAHHLSFSFFHLLFFNSFTFLIYIYIHTHTFLTQNVDWMSCFKIHSWKKYHRFL